MKLLVTYRNGKSETYIGVEEIKPIKNELGVAKEIYIETFLSATRLEKPRDPVLGGGVAKMELFF